MRIRREGLDFYVSVYDIRERALGAVHLILSNKPKERSGLTFYAKTMNNGLDQIHAYFEKEL